jgi:hypothetical protein
MALPRILKWLIWSFAAIIFLPVIAVMLFFALPSPPSKEPSDKFVQQNFRQNSNGYEGLLEMFRKDIAEFNVSRVSSEGADRTRCGPKPIRQNCSLRNGRWEEYQRLLKQLGILWIEYENPGERYYFVTYFEPFLMNARKRGVVFNEEKTPKVSVYYPKQEWWPIQDGWHSFLMVE